MVGKKAGEWIALGACAAILGSGWYGFELGPEPSQPGEAKLVEIVSWNWKRDRAGRILAVFGTVRNNTPEPYTNVVLELKTEDEAETVLARHAIQIGPIDANADKPFREDIPRTGRERMGYLEIKSLAR